LSQHLSRFGEVEPQLVERATELLQALTRRADARLRDDQLEAVDALVAARRRVLLVQRTGWGKSAVYFIATKLLREAGSGPTILVSPLLALMRNQIDAAARMGVRAASLNSSNRDQWAEVHDALDRDDVDVLLVAPERFANRQFRDEVLPVVSPRSGLLVIDEAHCISDWGHDFRPDYRRVTRILDLLPRGVPVLACTATANDRVVADVQSQLGDDLLLLRGPLAREGLALQVVDLPSAAERLVWLSTAIPSMPGTGIVYCLTIRDTELVAGWLRRQGIAAEAYSGDTDPDARQRVESRLLDNEVKVVAATSALGMGFDKPDLGFVVHFQSPGSPIAYYQQVGRAGRQLDTSHGVLLCGVEDRDIQDYFIRTAFPPEHQAQTIVDHLTESSEFVKLRDLEGVVNLSRTRLTAMLKQLEVDGAVEADGQKYRRTLRPWTYPHERAEGVTAQRRAEQQQMHDYAELTDCRMAFLQALLDDPHPSPCGVCDTCVGGLSPVALDPALVREAVDFVRSRPLTIEPRKQSATGSRLPADDQILEGRALSRWGDAGWGGQVRRNREVDGRYDDELVDALADLVRQWHPDPTPTWIAYVPSLRAPELVEGVAQRLGEHLGLPAADALARVRETDPQRTMENSIQQSRNVEGAFVLSGSPLPDGPALLVDDLVGSRWTLTEVGRLLRQHGCPAVLPVVLADVGGS
jgi:ATP-dependent DNA helicase RecQ